MRQQLLPGTQVLARGLQWEVVHSEPAGEQQRFRLRCLQGDLRGTEFDLLHPFETITPIATELDPERAGRLKQWLLYHDAFLLEQALGPSALLAVQPGRLDIAAYQFVPVMRALRMSRTRLLLADGVGLGKTIQAGLVMAELIARRRAHRILIVSPAGPLLNQWQREMRTRFGLRYTTIKDAGELREARRGLVLGANPFDHVSLCLTSIDFAKQEKVLQELERTSWDLVVIDEAHHCVKMSSRAGDWEASRRRSLAELMARQSDGLLLLTATPHDGYDPHFASVVELLDPSLVDGRGSLRGENYRKHVVRRLKDHIRDPDTGEPMFKKREVEPRAVVFGPETHPGYSAFQRTLVELVAPRLRRALRQRRYGEVLAFVSLLKRSVSTAAACRNTVRKIFVRYSELVEKGEEQKESRRQRLNTLREYGRRLERYGAVSWEEEQDQAELEAEEMAAELMATGIDDLGGEIDELRREQRRERDRVKRIESTRGGLDNLLALAEKAVAEDPKLRAVLEEVEAIRANEPEANILIYTEYTDSQAEVVTFLQGAVETSRIQGEILQISGPDPEAVRSSITERFGSEDNLILVSTDATAEGLNLQERCHHLVHLELPYNPNRLEQRNGRIDRYGQTQIPRVKYLYLAGTFEERLLLRLVAKYERQRARLTFVPNTLGGITTHNTSTVKLLEGLVKEEQTLFKRPPREITRIEEEPDDSGTVAYRELLAEVEQAMSGYEKVTKTNAWLGEQGLNADTRLVEEAQRAHAAGDRLGAVDLVRFVCDAVEDESQSGQAVVRHGESLLELQLPKTWTFGLDDLPGYDPESRRLRLTTDKQETRDGEGRSVGYLGRAHPVVRRALDRVRNIRFGETDAYLDRRVSAVAWDGDQPALLLTFLGVAESGNGREFERVIGVRASVHGTPVVMAEPSEWQALANPHRQVHLKGLWKRHFEGWAEARQDVAKKAAAGCFAELAEPFLRKHRSEVGEERNDLEEWLGARTHILCGRPQAVIGDLFSGSENTVARWKTLSEPTERLAAFATDGDNKPSERREADGVLRLYRQRTNDLDRRAKIRILPPSALGLLMLVPDGQGGK